MNQWLMQQQLIQYRLYKSDEAGSRSIQERRSSLANPIWSIFVYSTQTEMRVMHDQ